MGPGLSQVTAEEFYRIRGSTSSMFMDKDISCAGVNHALLPILLSFARRPGRGRPGLREHGRV